MTFMPSTTVRVISSGTGAGERWRTWRAAHPGGAGRIPQTVRLGGEHVVGGGVDDEPAAGVELAVELTFRPTGVPGEHPQVLDGDGQLDRVAPEIDGAEVPEHRRPSVRLLRGAGPDDADGGFGGHRAAREHDIRRGR